jgi:hypothetical protein
VWHAHEIREIHTGFLVENLKERCHSEQLCIGERIILNLSTDETIWIFCPVLADI